MPVQARLIGGFEAEQTQEDKTIRNDRMLSVALGSRLYSKVSDLDELPPTLVDEVGTVFYQLQQNAGPDVQTDREMRSVRGDEADEVSAARAKTKSH